MVAAGSVLAVFAHPDDEVLCAAGTLALCRAQGRPVTLVCATRGELGPIADARLATRETLASVREVELRASCAALDITDVRVLGLPDAEVAWAASQSGTLSALVQLIRTLRPKLLITFGPDGLYGHADHVAVHDLMTEARRAALDPGFAAELLVEPYRVPRVFYPVITTRFVRELLAALAQHGQRAQLWRLRPEDFIVSDADITASVDVSDVLDRKLRALHSHRTQLEHDNALALLSGASARRFLSIEHFRCADGEPGDPLA
jgi:LmbE family N-acetylglucosaminyl deacetylase